MSKIPLGMLVGKVHGLNGTMLGVGPMSTNLLESCFELAKQLRFPLMFIASRNQIDKKVFGSGYVNGWDQSEFASNIAEIAERYGFYDYYLCRDHGGPWQRDEERNGHLPVDKAMQLAKESFAADIEAGFDLIMVDPTKDPFVVGKVVELDFVLEKTIELIEFCEEVRKSKNLPEVYYEVGTEETNGGLTDVETYDFFIKRLIEELEKKALPKPTYVVGQTGTLVKSTVQAGVFDFRSACKLSDMAYGYGVYLKEHNADYLNESSLLEHIPARVAGANVAPEFGTVETRAYIKLSKVERVLLKNGKIKNASDFYGVLLEAAIKTGRWRKWVSSEKAKMSYEEIVKDSVLADEILEICGHYALNDEQVKNEREMMYANLGRYGINGNEFVKENIKTAITKYVDCFNLRGILDRIY